MKRVFGMALALSMSTSIIAQAAVFDGANIDTLNEKITVSGTSESSDMITVYMVKSDTEKVVFDDNADNVEHINILPVDAGEAYTYEFSYNKGGNYVIGAADEKGNKVLKLYVIADKTALDTLAESFYEGMSDSQIIEKIKPYADSLNITEQNLKSSRDTEIICKSITNNIDNIMATKSSGLISAVNSALKECNVIYQLESATQWYEVDAIITANATMLGIDLETYQNSSKRNSICVDILDMTIDSIEDVEELINGKLTKSTESPNRGGGGGGGGSSSVFTPSNYAGGTITKNGFNDLSEVLWAKEAIEYLADKGVLKGTGDNQFSPNSFVKREELAKMIVLAFGIDMKEGAEFTDVDPNQWYAPYISALVLSGISNGISNDEFGVGREVTRQDIAVILHRIMQNNEYSFKTEGKEFTDEAVISEYAKQAVKDMTAEGIINGVSETEFAPESPATRAQAAKLIYEVMCKLNIGGNINE